MIDCHLYFDFCGLGLIPGPADPKLVILVTLCTEEP